VPPSPTEHTKYHKQVAHPIMTDNEVWVQLYIGKTKSGEVFSIRPVPNNVDHLKKAAYAAKDKSLEHCNAADLVVYNAGTDFPKEEEVPLFPDDHVSIDTTARNPLRVVAPEKQPGKI
jgi:hypothetical protein